MRLIDADKLMEMIDDLYCSNMEQRDTVCYVMEEIEDAENALTVKAIPIEYIEKFKKEFRAVASVKEVIDWLLEDWGKENERP